MTILRLTAPVVLLVLAVVAFAVGLYLPAFVAVLATGLVLLTLLRRDDRAG